MKSVVSMFLHGYSSNVASMLNKYAGLYINSMEMDYCKKNNPRMLKVVSNTEPYIKL